MAMAILASVTVSIGEETKGVFIVICLVSAEVRSWTKIRRKAFSKIYNVLRLTQGVIDGMGCTKLIILPLALDIITLRIVQLVLNESIILTIAGETAEVM